MAVINTMFQLNKLVEQSTGLVGEKLERTHQKILCGPLKEYFPQHRLEEIHMELLAQGLFNPYEIRGVSKKVEELNNRNVWQMVQNEFGKLRDLWNGIDIPIYLYPLTEYEHPSGRTVKKNGVTFPSCLFLFIATDIEENELKALIAHEYHHACRLSILKKDSEEMELIDSLILEGMAEYVVEVLYGEQFLSPWTKSYSKEILKEQWEKNFCSKIDCLGVQNHFPYLYGSELYGLPSWIGYSLGYHFIQSFMDHQTMDLATLLQVPARLILQKSDFN